MKHSSLYQAMSLVLLGILTGCTGGDFGTTTTPTPVISHTQPKPTPAPTVPTTPTHHEATDTLHKPALGYLLKGAVRSDDSEIKALDTNDLQSLGDKPDLDHRLFSSHDTVNLTGLGKLAVINPKGTFSISQANYGDYQHVRFGHLIHRTNLAPNGKPIPQIYTFYHGDSPTNSLPTTNQIHYKGHWAYMSDARAKKAEEDKNISVDIHGADNTQHFHDLIDFKDTLGNAKSASATHFARDDLSSFNTANRYDNMIADFTVDFADKTLTGTLAYENPYGKPDKIDIRDDDTEDAKKQKIGKMRQPYTPLYHINANINQNRFIGTAKSQVQNTPRTISHYNTTYTHTDTRIDKALFGTDGVVEGGFYGEHGAELAGKFITNNNDLMGVFGAKKTTPTHDHATLFDNIQFDPTHDQLIKNSDLTDVMIDAPARLPMTLPVELATLAQDEALQDEIQEKLPQFWERLTKNIPNFSEKLTHFSTLSEEEQSELDDQYLTLNIAFEEEYTAKTVKQSAVFNPPESIYDLEDTTIRDDVKALAPEFWALFGKKLGNKTPEETEQLLNDYFVSLSDDTALYDAYDTARNEYLATVRGQVSSLVTPKNGVGFGDPTVLRVNGKAYNLNAKTTDDVLANAKAIKITQNGTTRTLVLAQTPDGKTSSHYINVCCDDFSHVKFGRFQVDDMTTPRYFVQGTRATSIPTEGQATYSGRWTGFIDSTRPRTEADAIYEKSPFVKHYFSDDANNNTANFTADFGKKTLTGQLLTGTQPVLDVHANITGTGFDGTAKTESAGFTFNRFSTGAKETIHINNAVVKGGFYGDNGKEIGGVIWHNNNDGKAEHFDKPNVRLGVVFGAVKQEK